MTANELADLIERCNDCGYNQDAAYMIRLQQTEISRLKALCISYINDEWSGTSSYQEKIDEVNDGI